MLISMIFLYVAGVIFICSRVELSVYIIFHVCCCELASPISWNHKPSRNMFFFQHLFVKCHLDLSLTRNTSIKLCALSLQFVNDSTLFYASEFFKWSHISCVKHTFQVQSGN